MDLNNPTAPLVDPYPSHPINVVPFLHFFPDDHIYVEFVGTEDQSTHFGDALGDTRDLPSWFEELIKVYLSPAPFCPMYRWHAEARQAEIYFRQLVAQLERIGEDDYDFFSTFSKLQLAFIDYLRAAGGIDSTITTYHSIMSTLLVNKMTPFFQTQLREATKGSTDRLKTQMRRCKYAAEKCFRPDWFSNEFEAIHDPIQSTPFEVPTRKRKPLELTNGKDENDEEATARIRDSDEVPSSQPEFKFVKPQKRVKKDEQVAKVECPKCKHRVSVILLDE
jgi:hypothetical protein